MKIRRQLSADEAIIRLETLCAASEQCRADLREKLRRWQVDDADRIIDELARRKFVDDARFARAYVRDKYRFARWGRAKIVMGLRAKHIGRDDIDEALSEIDADEYESILATLLRAKVRMARIADDYEGRGKLFRFAASRGFESSLVSRLIGDRTPWHEED